jgi:hypothetical protein
MSNEWQNGYKAGYENGYEAAVSDLKRAAAHSNSTKISDPGAKEDVSFEEAYGAMVYHKDNEW